FKVNPLDGPNMWPKSNLPGKLTREGKSVTCTKYGQVGHNQRSYKGQRSTNTSQTAKKPASGSQTQTGSLQVVLSLTNYINWYGFTKKDD
ncbi:hypothetical protein Tco_1179372, partial [Tanacetum coccineum]